MPRRAYQSPSRAGARLSGIHHSLRRLALIAAAGLGVCASALAFDLQGHRGARGLAPENTLAGFATALRVGVNTLELDLGISRDGVVVISHDPRLNPDITRDADGRWITAPAPAPAINSLTLAELQRHDVGRLRPDTPYAQRFSQQVPADGERLPTLAALFGMVKAAGADQVRFNIEIKQSPLEPALTPAPEAFAKAVLAVVRQHGMASRVTIQGFDWRSLQVVRELAPEIPVAALTVRQGFLDNLGDPRWTGGLKLTDHGGSAPRLVKALGASIWSPFHLELNAESLQEARSLGLKVIPWTVNEPAQIDALLALGVDGLISDHPERVREAMARRGMPLPPVTR
jgi:glycerophosphoryl diester phosphodiesterase